MNNLNASEKPRTAKVIRMFYQPPSELCRGTEKDYEHFLLVVNVDGSKHEIWTEGIFRKAFQEKKLTKKLQKAVKKTMPLLVEIVKYSGNGRSYFTLSGKTITLWKKRVFSRGLFKKKS